MKKTILITFGVFIGFISCTNKTTITSFNLQSITRDACLYASTYNIRISEALIKLKVDTTMSDSIKLLFNKEVKIFNDSLHKVYYANLRYQNKLDSISFIENKLKAKKNDEILRKRIKEREKEERQFLKTKAGRVYTYGKKKGMEWSKSECQSVAEGRYWIGMNVWMLVWQRGNPNASNPSNYGNGNQYQYCWYDYTPTCYYDHDGDGNIDAYN